MSMSMIPLVADVGVNINQLALLGVGSTIIVMLLAILSQVGLSFLAQRNLNDQLSLGMQAIVGSNNMRIVDDQQDDGSQSSSDNDGSNN